jgi:FAD dependent oxidoreductase TIGR03364
MSEKTAIVIGAGIAGLATARALSMKGYQVKVIDKSGFATGASVRNFGMIWPIGQPSGEWYEAAMRSRAVWMEIAQSGAFWCEAAGSLHLAYAQDEWEVLKEAYELFVPERNVALVSVAEMTTMAEAVNPKGLLGALYSMDELLVDPREAIGALPAYLTEKYGVEFLWNRCVSYVADNTVYVGNDEEYEAGMIIICSGADFETLYPETFRQLPLTKCKLQMLRLQAQPDGWRMGPALCGGLSLIHYNSFKQAGSLAMLRSRYEQELPQYLDAGIHVMAAQNGRGEITIGDSHEYGLTQDPFDRQGINQLILQYLSTFAVFKNETITETWNGVYSKLTDGDTHFFLSPEPGVYIFNGLGGAGMTLAFGLADELVQRL